LTVGALPAEVQGPLYDRAAQARGIVHLGIGAFHRAHQAVYTDDAMNDGDRDWAITGVSLRSASVRDSLNPQDGLYGVLTKGGGPAQLRMVGAIRDVLVAPEDPAAVVAAIADPATKIVTLTVTEKGYYRRPGQGGLLADDPVVAADLRGEAPRTIYGCIAGALAQRKSTGAGPLTLVSCDNLSGNGHLLQSLLAEFLDLRDPALRAWADANVACPDTMVDRIVPATTEEEIVRAQGLSGLRDEALVVTEPFRQWVIEDRFAGPRPRWEAGGAQLVEDVAPFELAKLRLLNGSHSALAYIGLALGHAHVHEAVSDSDLNRFVRAQATDEAAPSLPAAAGLDPAGYVEAIFARFDNANLPHKLAQIAMDGSQKIPQRWLATLTERSARGEACGHHLLSLAAWIAYTRGRDAEGNSYVVDDPLWQRFAAIWSDGGEDVGRVVDRFVRESGVFPEGFADRPGLIEPLKALLNEWLGQGPRATLRRFLSGRGREI
jgi:fructuronate reductase